MSEKIKQLIGIFAAVEMVCLNDMDMSIITSNDFHYSRAA